MKHTKLLLALTLTLTLLALVSCSFLFPQPKSAYDLAVENGFTGTLDEWLNSLNGADGKSAYAIAVEKGFQGTEEEWLASMKGDEGQSAYALYCEHFGYEGTEEQWLVDLRTGALISYKVTFDLNGGERPTGFVASVTVPGGSFLDLTIPTREGYTFIGWYTGDGDTDYAMTATTAVRSNLSLKAKWRSNVLSVRFLDKEGKLLKQETVPYGGAATPPDAPEVAQFLFKKWDVDFSVITEDLIVKAVYSPLYKLSFNTDGGTMMTDVTYCADEIPAIPTAPIKSGYIFAGWYADKDFTVPYGFSTPLTQNTTIFACFSDMIPISNAEELKAIGDNSTGKFYLTNDINLGGEVWTPIVDFAGEFDGQGYKIHNFIISETQSAGFFTTNSGTIKNLTLADFVFTVSTQNVEFTAGALVGINESVVKNCRITDATLTYDYTHETRSDHESNAGGLVGVNNGSIIDSTVSGKLNASLALINGNTNKANLFLYVGGITSTNRGNITNTTTDLVVKLSANNSSGYSEIAMGGLVAGNSGSIVNCQSNTDLVCDSTRADPEGWFEIIRFGGLAQSNSGTVSQGIAVSSIQMVKSFYIVGLGGFVDQNHGEIKDCLTQATIETLQCSSFLYAQSTSRVGGFVSENGGTIASCYAICDIETVNQGYVGSFAGSNESGGVISKCFASGNIVYTDTPFDVGCFVGTTNEGGTLFKNYYNSESKILQGETDVTVEDSNATATDLATLQSKAFLVDTLGWNTEVWEIVDGQYPTLAKDE